MIGIGLRGSDQTTQLGTRSLMCEEVDSYGAHPPPRAAGQHRLDVRASRTPPQPSSAGPPAIAPVCARRPWSVHGARPRLHDGEWCPRCARCGLPAAKGRLQPLRHSRSPPTLTATQPRRRSLELSYPPTDRGEAGCALQNANLAEHAQQSGFHGSRQEPGATLLTDRPNGTARALWSASSPRRAGSQRGHPESS